MTTINVTVAEHRYHRRSHTRRTVDIKSSLAGARARSCRQAEPSTRLVAATAAAARSAGAGFAQPAATSEPTQEQSMLPARPPATYHHSTITPFADDQWP